MMKVGVVHDGGLHLVGGECEEDGDNVESLMQERVGDNTVTVDEHVGNTTQDVPNHPLQGPQIYPSNFVPFHGPNLPMVSPLQLVYLQSTPHGVNIVPVQAAGHPTFTPYSPLGFPAHPNHPVVVQQGHFLPPQTSPFFSQHQAFYRPGPHTLPMYPTVYSGYPVQPQQPRTEPILRPRQPRFFRPWEDKNSSCCPHKDCGGKGDHHTQPVIHEETRGVPSLGEEDFPALSQQMASVKIKK